MNLLYNSTDCQILLTSNEGWGLSLTEAILVGNPIIANKLKKIFKNNLPLNSIYIII